MIQYSDEYHEYLKSPECRKKREELFEIRGCKCEKCGSEKLIQVHHLTYKRIYEEKMTDLMVLCRKCHEKAHGIKNGKKPKVAKVKKKKSRSRQERNQYRIKVLVSLLSPRDKALNERYSKR